MAIITLKYEKGQKIIYVGMNRYRNKMGIIKEKCKGSTKGFYKVEFSKNEIVICDAKELRPYKG